MIPLCYEAPVQFSLKKPSSNRFSCRCFSSIFLHTVLAFERYLAVCHPQHVYSTARHHKKPASSRKMVGGHSSKNNNAADKAIRKKVKRETINFTFLLPLSTQAKHLRRQKSSRHRYQFWFSLYFVGHHLLSTWCYHENENCNNSGNHS